MSYNDFHIFSNDTIRVNIRIFTVLFKHRFQHDSTMDINIGCKYTETDSEYKYTFDRNVEYVLSFTVTVYTVETFRTLHNTRKSQF